MTFDLDPALMAMFGSRARLLTMAVLANAERPMTGYRVAAVAGLPRPMVYPEIRKGISANVIVETARGYRFADADLRDLLRKRVRISWLEDTVVGEAARAVRSARVARDDDSWFDPSKYTPNPRVAARYAKEFARPPEKGPSRKTSWR
jgi:hypothetical protein